MNFISLIPILLFALSLAAQETTVATIKHVDMYGLRSVDSKLVDKALGFRKGSPTTVDRKPAVARLRAIDGIADAVIIQMFIPGNEIMLVGIREDRAPVLQLRAPPSGELRLPKGMVSAYESSMKLGYEGMMKGESREHRDGGHSFSYYKPRAEQERLLAKLARANPDEVRAVLRSSKHAKERVVAAKAISYLEDKSSIVPDLAFAMTDCDSGVRNNAIRVLSVLADWARSQDDFEVTLDATPLLVLLESLEWTDRNKSAALIDGLTVGRDTKLLNQLRGRSIPALVEMSLWHSRGHAAYSVNILGRLARLKDSDTTSRDRAARRSGDEAHRRWVAELGKMAAIPVDKKAVDRGRGRAPRHP